MAVPVRQGKVRDVYDIGEFYLMVASDRISAFDYILPTLIPDKGRVLTQISKFWFDYFDVPNHLVSTDLSDIDLPEGLSAEELEGRTMVVKKCEVVPIECVVRGYLVGSGWKDYQSSGAVCGIDLPAGLQNCAKFPEAIFTPATKAEEGHDENVSFERVVQDVGLETAEALKAKSLHVYTQGRDYAASKGIILADTKFEWGFHNGELILIDEVMTPDSSRFWPADRMSLAAINCLLTNSSSGSGWNRRRGTKIVLRRNCRLRSSRRLEKSTSMRSSDCLSRLLNGDSGFAF